MKLVGYCETSSVLLTLLLVQYGDANRHHDSLVSAELRGQEDLRYSKKTVHRKSVYSVQKEKCYSKNRHACDVECDQGIIRYHGDCCVCICKKNYALVNQTRCIRAKWTAWASWSNCIKSGWGGLQTRERKCKASGAIAAGACVGRGSMSRTCSEVKKSFRIRKNLKELTNYEIHDLIQAMTKFKRDTSKNGYRNIISWHGWPGRCPWYHKSHKDNHCSWHYHPLFLPWHRLITIQLEDGLSRFMHNKTLGIPFWDWTEKAEDIPGLLRDQPIYDPVLMKSVHNPFHSTYIRQLHGHRLYTQRHPWYQGLLMQKYILKGTVRALLSHNHYDFSEQLSRNPHDQIHDCFCWSYETYYGIRRCDYGMPTVDYAAFDPAFLLHHSAIDRLFVMRRLLEEENGMSDWTSSRTAGQYAKGLHRVGHIVPKDVTESFRWPMSPFCNKSMNPNPLTLGKYRWTAHKSYYNTQLFGYKYTNFNLGGGYSWEDLKKDYKRIVVDSRFWNDEYFDTKIGMLYPDNSKNLKRVMECTTEYSNPPLNTSITWK